MALSWLWRQDEGYRWSSLVERLELSRKLTPSGTRFERRREVRCPGARSGGFMSRSNMVNVLDRPSWAYIGSLRASQEENYREAKTRRARRGMEAKAETKCARSFLLEICITEETHK